MTINNYQHNGTTAIYTVNADLSASSAACTTVSGGRNCSVMMTAVGGNDDFTFASYDVTPATAGFGTSAHQLGTASISGLTILVGQTNTINVALSGIINTIRFSVSQPTIYLPAAKTFNVGVTALDIDGNIILAGLTTVSNGGVSQTDTYANPITVSVAESGTGAGTGHTKLSLNGGTATNSVTTTKSSDAITLSYDGNAAANTYGVQLGGAATGVATATSNINFLSISASGAGIFSGGLSPTLSFSAANQIETITVTEPNFTGTFGASITNLGSTGCPGSSVALNTGSLHGTGTTFTITAGTANATACSISATDNITATATLALSASVTGGGSITVPIPNNVLYATAFGSSGSEYVAALSPTAYGTSPPVNPTMIRLNLADGTTTNSISGSLTQLQRPIGVAHDAAGNVYVADAEAGKIFKFSAASSGNVAPAATITSSSLTMPDGLALDASGRIYVDDYTTGNILVFAANASGPSTPVSTMQVNAYGPIAVDSAGDVYGLYSGGCEGNEVAEYAAPAAGTTSPTPFRTFATDDCDAAAIAVDPSGNVFASDDVAYNVEEFAAGGSSVTPSARFNPSNGSGTIPGFGYIAGFGGIAVDGAGHLYAEGFANTNGLIQYVTWQVSSPATNPTLNSFATPNLTGTNSQVGLMAF
jgi:hypothetical protein